METKQVIFRDPDGDCLAGIMIDNKFIICACCGGVFEMDEVQIIQTYAKWVDFSDYIM